LRLQPQYAALIQLRACCDRWQMPAWTSTGPSPAFVPLLGLLVWVVIKAMQLLLTPQALSLCTQSPCCTQSTMHYMAIASQGTGLQLCCFVSCDQQMRLASDMASCHALSCRACPCHLDHNGILRGLSSASLHRPTHSGGASALRPRGRRVGAWVRPSGGSTCGAYSVIHPVRGWPGRVLSGQAYDNESPCKLLCTSMGLLGVARANTAVGVSHETHCYMRSSWRRSSTGLNEQT
jgi:hypothetical protein